MQISYSKPVSHGPHQGGPASSQGPCHSPCINGGGGSGGGGGSSISHTVSTPELANTKQQGTNAGTYAATANMLRNHMSRPPPPYPSNSFRPATSTPDLASHRHRCIGGSSPELVTRMVQLSVKTFQPDSSAVVHQSLQEVSEPLTAAAKHRSTLGKRHSMEVISSMRGGGAGMEGIVMKGMNAPLLRRNTLREHVMPPQPPQPVPPPQPQTPLPQPQPQPQPQPLPQQPKELPIQMPAQKAPDTSVVPPAAVAYQHQKTLSNATMLIHSSESEEEEEEEEERPELDVQIPGLNEDISAQLQAALAKLPNKPPPEYPGPSRPPSSAQIRTHNHTHHHNHTQGPQGNQGPMELNQAQGLALKTGQSEGAGGPGVGVGAGGTLTRGDQGGVNGAVLGPSISEPDLTSVKERVRKEPVKERPVSEMFSLEDSIVEREIAQRVSQPLANLTAYVLFHPLNNARDNIHFDNLCSLLC